MDEIKAIKDELRDECGNPFYNFCKAIIDPMMNKIWQADADGLAFPEAYPEPITWGETFKIVWNWGLAMTRESEIRPILAECKELIDCA